MRNSCFGRCVCGGGMRRRGGGSSRASSPAQRADKVLTATPANGVIELTQRYQHITELKHSQKKTLEGKVFYIDLRISLV